MTTTAEFDKYHYYLAAVQCPESDCDFLLKAYGAHGLSNDGLTLREDFCGTFALCTDFVQREKNYRAVAIDIDAEPLTYGKKHFLGPLSPEQADRVLIMQKDVLDEKLPEADIIASLNFSYFCFKKRTILLDYLRKCHSSLNKGGILVLDCFGGSDCFAANEQEIEFDDFSYFWDQDSFNYITHETKFHIHFQLPNEQKRERVFTYDWRLWTVPELTDLLAEAGFQTTTVYWEGNDEDGDGDGIFSPTIEGEECESWVAYIVATK